MYAIDNNNILQNLRFSLPLTHESMIFAQLEKSNTINRDNNNNNNNINTGSNNIISGFFLDTGFEFVYYK
jgi:hypothetical protein